MRPLSGIELQAGTDDDMYGPVRIVVRSRSAPDVRYSSASTDADESEGDVQCCEVSVELALMPERFTEEPSTDASKPDRKNRLA